LQSRLRPRRSSLQDIQPSTARATHAVILRRRDEQFRFSVRRRSRRPPAAIS